MGFHVTPESLFEILTLLPQVERKSSTTNLAAAASVTLDFSTDFSPMFDVDVFMDQAGTLLTQYQDAGGTWRTFRTDTITANTATFYTAQRVPGVQVRIRLTNDGAVATTALNLQAISRSI